MELTTYKVRAGNATPALCSGKVEKVCVFFFGSEQQKVYFCTKDDEVIRTEDTSLLNDSEHSIYSAEYKAYPEKEGEDIIYNSVITTPPIMSPLYDF